MKFVMINEVEVGSHLNDAMMGMSAYALLQRAIPDFRDGFKPVHRRIISSMVINGTKNFTKSATVEGRIMQLHPHGGSYGSIVGLVQKDRNNLPFLVGKGSWGQNTSSDHTPAAARYTEVKLGANALEITKELKEKSVDYIPNYDGTIMVPEVLPVTYPTILTQSQSGMAIGFASSTLSYNIYELRDAIKDLFKKKKIKTIYPDFPTGALIIENEEAAREIIETGRGSLRIRSKMEVSGNKIIATEIPYGTKREAIIKRIIELNKKGDLKEITDVRDGTSFKGMKIVITFRKNCDPKEIIAKLYKLTPLESSVSANFNVLINGTPKVAGVEELLINWINWRKEILKKGMQNQLEKMKYDLHILSGLKKIVDIDEAIRIIRFEEDDLVDKKLMETFGLSEIQAEYIGKMTLRSLNEKRIEKRLAQISSLEEEIKTLEENINSEKFIEKELIDRMNETIKTIGASKRKTEIIQISEEEEKVAKKVKKALKEASDHEVTVTITESGWVYKSDQNGNNKFDLMIGDDEKYSIPMKNNDRFAAFLEGQEIGLVTVDDVDEKKGIFLPTYFDKKIIDYIFPMHHQTENNVLLGFEDGHIVKIPFDSFLVGTRKILKNGYWKDEKLVFIHQIEDDEKVVQIKFDNKKKNIDIENINIKQNRSARGQWFIRPKGKVKFSVL